MDEQKLQEFKKRLEEQTEKFKKDLSYIAKKDPDVKNDYDVKFEDYGRDEDENAQEVADLDARVGEEHVIELKLLATKKALERIEDGSYGKCEKCGGEIQMERLEAVPEANTCMKCNPQK